MRPFTMEVALKYQEDHLQKWEAILKPEVAKKLREIVLAQNTNLQFPWQVCRGGDIDYYVHNAAKFLQPS
jgi:hypothetical protein